MPSNAEMVDYIMPISTNYVFGGSRYEPRDTDCSGMMCAAMWHVHGVDPYTFGDCTGAQWNGGLLRKLWWGTDPYLPWDIAQKGDFIYTSTVAPSFDTGQGSHVGLYTGDPNAPFLSHFANGGPYVTAVNGVYGGNERYFGLARYMPGSEDDMEPHDVWEYNWRDTAPGGNMYNCMLDIHKNAQSHNVWEYYWIDETGKNNAPGGNMYNCLLDIHKKVAALEKTVDNIKIGGASIDYDKLAKALAPVVADELSARLKA